MRGRQQWALHLCPSVQQGADRAIATASAVPLRVDESRLEVVLERLLQPLTAGGEAFHVSATTPCAPKASLCATSPCAVDCHPLGLPPRPCTYTAVCSQMCLSPASVIFPVVHITLRGVRLCHATATCSAAIHPPCVCLTSAPHHPHPCDPSRLAFKAHVAHVAHADCLGGMHCHPVSG